MFRRWSDKLASFMADLKTYNQVKQLERAGLGTLLSVSYLLCMFIASLCLLGLFFLTLYWMLLLLGLVGCLVFMWIVVRLQRTRRRDCRFCGTPLQEIERPFFLSEEHFWRHGLLFDEVYYLRRSSLFTPGVRWVKPTNRSFVCHHCRIHEKDSRQLIEPVSEELAERLISEWRR